MALVASQTPSFLRAFLCNAFQQNDWNDARSVLLVFAEAGCLSHNFGKEAVTLFSLRKCRASFQLFATHLKRYIGMGK